MTKHSKLTFQGEQYNKNKCDFCDYTVITTDQKRTLIKLKLHYKIAHKKQVVFTGNQKTETEIINKTRNRNFLL